MTMIPQDLMAIDTIRILHSRIEVSISHVRFI